MSEEGTSNPRATASWQILKLVQPKGGGCSNGLGCADLNGTPARLCAECAMLSLSQKEMRQLRARAQTLKAVLKVGKQGLSPEFLQALDEALNHRELLKVKFDDFKEARRELAPEMAVRSRSLLVTLVGNVAVLYRPKPPADPASGSAGESQPSTKRPPR
jgi:RNA-binding protein